MARKTTVEPIEIPQDEAAREAVLTRALTDITKRFGEGADSLPLQGGG